MSGNNDEENWIIFQVSADYNEAPVQDPADQRRATPEEVAALMITLLFFGMIVAAILFYCNKKQEHYVSHQRECKSVF